jgi:prepilin-type N-terminal cleavage/methylation domain-containing protein
MRRDESGVTLTEVAVVLVVMAILAAAIVPTLGNVLAIMRSKGAAEEVASAVRLARQYAITRGNSHCIRFSGAPVNTVFTIYQDAGCTSAMPSHTGQSIGHEFAIVSPNNLSIVFNPVGNVTNFTPGNPTVTLGVDSNPPVCLSSVLVSLYGGVRVTHGC